MKKIEANKNIKKTAIVCYGSRISLDCKNCRSVGYIFMREYLLNILGREVVDFVAKKSKKEKDLDYFKDLEQTDLNDYEEVYIYNCSFNLFGGRFDYENLILFEKLYKFKGDICYLLVDPKMPCWDYTQFLKSRDKDNNRTFKCSNDDIGNEYQINEEAYNNWTDVVWKRIKIAYAGIDYEKYVKLYNQKNKNRKGKELNEDCEWFNFFIFDYSAINERLDAKLKDYDKIDNPYDLVYFGNDRHNERNKMVAKYYDNKEFSKYFIGFNPNMENTEWTAYVDHDEMFELIGTKCLATVVFGDYLHHGNERTPRFFEAMLLDVVGFIHIDFDPTKSYIKNEFLRDFIYINSPADLWKKLRLIKSDPNLYKKIVELERQDILKTFDCYRNK